MSSDGFCGASAYLFSDLSSRAGFKPVDPIPSTAPSFIRFPGDADEPV